MAGNKNSGRKPSPIDLNVVEALARVHATQAEIAAELRVSVKTLQNHIKRYPEVREAIENGQLRGKVSLRRVLVSRAIRGSDTCLVFALKNLCGFRDRIEQEHKITSVKELPDDTLMQLANEYDGIIDATEEGSASS